LVEDLRPKIYKPPARSQSTKPSNKSVSYTPSQSTLNTNVSKDKQDSTINNNVSSFNHTPVNNYKNASNNYLQDDTLSLTTMKTIDVTVYSTHNQPIVKAGTNNNGITKPTVQENLKDRKNFVYSTLNINNLIISENANSIKNILQKKKEGGQPQNPMQTISNSPLGKKTALNQNTSNNTFNHSNTFSNKCKYKQSCSS
jgi:hypothetical protein